MTIGWLIIGDSNLFTWHFSSLLPGLIALSPIFAILGLMKRRQWFIFHSVPAFLFIVLYASLYIPRSVNLAADSPQLRMMTFNTQYRVKEAPELVKIILEADADVIALQELSESTATYFLEHLSEDYPYQISHTWGTSVRGKALLSRYPLNNEVFDEFEGWIYLRAQIEFENEVLTLVNVHPPPPHYGINFNSRDRSDAIDWIMAKLAGESGAIIMMGDFNTTDQSDDYRQITSKYADSFREVGIGLGQTFPDYSGRDLMWFLPMMIRIDYIFHSEDLQAVSAQVWHESAGSDHHPLIANLKLKSD